MLSDHTMAYGRVGVVRSRFEFSNSTPGTTDVRKNINGGQIGLGLQTSLTQNLDLRGEYDYTKYKTTKLSNTTDFDPRADSFNLGLVYKFD
jgi:outer membrane autotransporter protein